MGSSVLEGPTRGGFRARQAKILSDVKKLPAAQDWLCSPGETGKRSMRINAPVPISKALRRTKVRVSSHRNFLSGLREIGGSLDLEAPSEVGSPM